MKLETVQLYHFRYTSNSSMGKKLAEELKAYINRTYDQTLVEPDAIDAVLEDIRAKADQLHSENKRAIKPLVNLREMDSFIFPDHKTISLCVDGEFVGRLTLCTTLYKV